MSCYAVVHSPKAAFQGSSVIWSIGSEVTDDEIAPCSGWLACILYAVLSRINRTVDQLYKRPLIVCNYGLFSNRPVERKICLTENL